MSEVNKPLIKGLSVSGDISNRVKLLSSLLGANLANAELLILVSLVKYTTNNSLFITPIISRQIRQENNLGDSAVSTALFRLVEKGLIIRSGKTITLHPAFMDLNNLDKLVISFK